MKIESIPVTFTLGRKKYTIEGSKFKPSKEVMYRFLVDISKKDPPIAIVLYESTKPGPKFNWDYESPERNHIANAIAKALEKAVRI